MRTFTRTLLLLLPLTAAFGQASLPPTILPNQSGFFEYVGDDFSCHLPRRRLSPLARSPRTAPLTFLSHVSHRLFVPPL